METKISNVTTKMNVEDVVNGYRFKGTAEVYNNNKTIKSLNATITKEGQPETSPGTAAGTTGGQYCYVVSRSISDGMAAGGMFLPSDEEGETMLAAGIAFEKVVETAITGMEFNNI